MKLKGKIQNRLNSFFHVLLTSQAIINKCFFVYSVKIYSVNRPSSIETKKDRKANGLEQN